MKSPSTVLESETSCLGPWVVSYVLCTGRGRELSQGHGLPSEGLAKKYGTYHKVPALSTQGFGANNGSRMSCLRDKNEKESLMETVTEPQKSAVSTASFRKNLGQNGEATLFCVLVLVVLSGLLTLSALELQRNYSLLKKRTHLFLCAKEMKGELGLYLTFMGRLNWVIKNTTKAQMVAVFIPPLAPFVGNAEKLKKVAKSLQALELVDYKTKLLKLANQGCPMDPQVILNPYELGTDFGFQRSSHGAAKLRKKEWTYYIVSLPYVLTLKTFAHKAEGLTPIIDIRAEEKGAMLSSLLSSR